jgi:uncharacterized RDD family membrane protein YckC
MTASHDNRTPPSIRRRLACLVYEGVLLFGIVMVVGLIYSLTTQQRHALQGAWGMQLTLFVVIGCYFVYFWTHSGQTLAMQTWHIRLVTRDGEPVTPARATARYLLAWLWFGPALAGLKMAGLQAWAPFAAATTAGVLAYALLARLHPERQFFHDVVCGTRLETWHRPPARSTVPT